MKLQNHCVPLPYYLNKTEHRNLAAGEGTRIPKLLLGVVTNGYNRGMEIYQQINPLADPVPSTHP